MDENQQKSSFGLEYNQVLDSNEGKGFIRVTPKDIEDDLDKMFMEGKAMGDSSGIVTLDPIFRLRKKGGLYVFSGYEGSGKSEILKFLCKMAAEIYGFKAAMFSPEEETEDIIEDLARTYLGKNTNQTFKDRCTIEEWNKAKEWINKHFIFLEYDGMVNFDILLAEYEYLAESQGVKIFITDPWNYIAEGAFDEGGIKYLKVALSHMKTFSRRYGVHNIIVEHQNNPKPKKDGEIPKANKWNITGGSMWRNKPDCIVIITKYWTEANQDTRIDFDVVKSKGQRYNGQTGSRSLWFEIATGRYLEKDPKALEKTGHLDFSESEERNESDDDLPF